jgi:HemY protein
MILYPFLFLLIIGVLYVVGLMLLRNSQDLTILWGQSMTVEVSTFTLAMGLLLGFAICYIVVAGVYTLLMAPRRINQRNDIKRVLESQQDLKDGMVSLVEGHFSKAEKMMMQRVGYSETPLLNYLGAARAAHMRQAYPERDEYLKTASAYGSEAEIAVAVSQATMQFESGQIEQARATLIHLRELSPSHPFPNQLLAQVYYQQEDWRHLAQLVPELLKPNKTTLTNVQTKQYQSYMKRAVVGLFEANSGKQDLAVLGDIWQSLPSDTQQQVYAVEAYSNALNNAGGGDVAVPVLEQAMGDKPARELLRSYGLIEHRWPKMALEKVLSANDSLSDDPAYMLCLARLYKQIDDHENSANYYEKALMLVPDQRVYHELGELLTLMGDALNAGRCYRQGLRYCVQGKTRPFKRQ